MGTGQDDRSLTDLTTQMSGWGAPGSELRLDEGKARKFLGRLDTAIAQLGYQRTGAQGLQSWLAGADVSQFVSAIATRGDLQEDIRQFIEAIDKYNEYLEALKQATARAGHIITVADQPK